jgi:hypothetical protein
MSSRKHPFEGPGIEGSLRVSPSGTPSGGPSCWSPPSTLILRHHNHKIELASSTPYEPFPSLLTPDRFARGMLLVGCVKAPMSRSRKLWMVIVSRWEEEKVACQAFLDVKVRS